MKRLLQLFLLLVAAVAGYFIWSWMHPTPEQAIRKQMEKLGETLATKPNEGNIARVAAINRTLSFFMSDVYINGDDMAQVNQSIQGKTELQQALFAARQRLAGAITFHDIRVLVAVEETNATVNFTAAARLSGQEAPFTQDLKAQFQKIEGDWLISRVDPIALKTPAAEEK